MAFLVVLTQSLAGMSLRFGDTSGYGTVARGHCRAQMAREKPQRAGSGGLQPLIPAPQTAALLGATNELLRCLSNPFCGPLMTPS